MAEGMKYCTNCGTAIRPGTRFCGVCGAKLPIVTAPKPAVAKSVKRSCPECGSEVSDTAKFCRKCGYKFGQELRRSAPEPAMPPAIGNVSRSVTRQGVNQVSAAARELIGGDMAAAARPGEFAVMDFSPNALSDAAAPVQEVLAPFSAIGSGIKSFLRGIPGLFKSPKTLIITLVLGVLWIWLGMNRGSDSMLIKALSWLTFAEGGYDRSPAGMLSGMAGKGVVGVVLASVFSGGIGDFLSGLGALFKKTDTKRSVLFMLFGFIAGILLYLDFAGGMDALGSTAMAGIAGAILSIQALGRRDGCIYRIAEAFTSKKINGFRNAQDGRANSFLGGITAGFAIITSLSCLCF